jgi:hypothetical protein
MYIRRRKAKIDGVYQATSFENKPPNSSGLRTGGYFLSLEACQKIKQFYVAKSLRAKRKPESTKIQSSQNHRHQTESNSNSTSSITSPIQVSVPSLPISTSPPPRGNYMVAGAMISPTVYPTQGHGTYYGFESQPYSYPQQYFHQQPPPNQYFDFYRNPYY